jgi:hypothetical protein
VIGSHEDIVNKVVYYFLYNTTSQSIESTNNLVFTATNHGLQTSDLITVSGLTSRPTLNGNWIVERVTANTFKLVNRLRFVASTDDEYSSTGTTGVQGSFAKYSHSVLKFDSTSNSISLVYKHSRFNFNTQYPVTGSAFINGVLSWTDGYNPPRSLKVNEASTYGTFFLDNYIDFIKLPPTVAPTGVGRWINEAGTVVAYSTNKKLSNFMNDKSYQFICRYTYTDSSRSVWGPLSELIPTGYIEDRKNNILLTINNEETRNYNYFSKIISFIEIAFREGDTLNFKYIDRIPFPMATSVDYSFSNDKGYATIAIEETSKYFESIPKISGALTSIQNRVFMGDCTEGFDVDPDDFSVDENSIEYRIVSNPTKNRLVFKSNSLYDIGVVFYDRADRKSGVHKLFRAKTEGSKYTLDGVPNTDTTLYKRLVSPEIRFALSGTPPEWATHYQIVRTNNIHKSFILQGFAKIINTSADTFKIKFNDLNGNIAYNFDENQFIDILYSLANVSTTTTSGGPRPSTITTTAVTLREVTSTSVRHLKIKSVNAGGELVIELPDAYTTLRNTNAIASADDLQVLGIEIYTEAQSQDGIYYECSKCFPVINPGTDQRRFGDDNASTNKVISLTSGDVSLKNPDASPYVDSFAQFTIQGAAISTSPYIIVFNGITVTYVPYIGEPAISIAVGLVSQINAFGNGLYAATMLSSPAILSGVAAFINVQFLLYSTRKGTLGNLNITSVAGFLSRNIDLISGTKAQEILNGIYFEYMSPSDSFFETWNKNIGRPGVILTEGDKEVRKKEVVRYGGNYVTGTALNNVPSFNSLDEAQLTNAGAIRKLIAATNNQAEGTVILGVQENEISSLYIGQSVLTNPGGGQSISATDRVIGTINPLQKLVGTINPESVVQHNGLVYGFDALRGIVWRYGQDGLNFISESGMNNFFYARSQYLISLGTTFKCYGGIDPFHEEYVLVIPNTDSTKTSIAWSENTNKWTSFRSYIPEWMQKINTKLITFKNGQLWIHTNGTYNNFYGIQYESQLRMICNHEPDKVKILQVVEEMAHGGHWNCSDIATPEGQSSELLGIYDIANPNNLPADFRDYENKYVGVVMRDKNTPNMETSDYPLLNGDSIRSQVFDILMVNPRTTRQNLFMVNLGYIESYKTY